MDTIQLVVLGAQKMEVALDSRVTVIGRTGTIYEGIVRAACTERLTLAVQRYVSGGSSGGYTEIVQIAASGIESIATIER